MFVRYSYRKTFSAPAIFFPEDIAVAEGRVNEQNRAHNAVIDYNRTMSNTTVLNARLGFARTLFIFDNQGLGLQAVEPRACRRRSTTTSIGEMFPRFGVGGMVTLGGNDHRYNAFMSYTAAASLTKVRGAHALKVGFEGRMLRVNVWEARSAGTFNFRANETQGPNPTTASSTAGYGIRVVPARLRPAQRRADPELEERRGQQLLLGGLRAGRLAHQHAPDRSTSGCATTSTCRARSATTA